MNTLDVFPRSGDLFKALGAPAAAQIIAAAADMTLIVDRKGVVKDLAFRNPRLKRDLRSVGNWLGSPWIDTVTLDSRPKVEALLDEAMRDQGPHLRHINHPAVEGADVAIQYSAVGIHGQDLIAAFGNDLRPLSLLQQRLVEAQQSLERDYSSLRQAQQRYRVLFDTSLDPLIVLDAVTLKIVEFNAAARQLTADTGGGGIHTRIPGFADLFDPHDRPAVSRFLGAMRISGRADALRSRLATSGLPGGGPDSAREITISASLLHEDEGALLLVRLSEATPSIDLTRTTLNGRLVSALEQAPDGFVFTDETGTVLGANAAFLSLAQLASLDQVRGRKLADWLGRAGMEVDMDVLIANLRQRGSVRLYTTVLRGQNGGETSVEISAVTLRGSEPAAYGFAIRDVARRIAAAESRQAVELGRSPEQLVELIGRVSLKDLVRDATDVIERLCIEAALKLSGDNRASAAEMLGLSRQSLYVKLRRYGLGDLDDNAAAEDPGAFFMTARTGTALPVSRSPAPAPAALLELLKPITWFAPMWAFGCGLVSSNRPISAHWLVTVAGILLAGPLLCGTSQAVNDWFDRHVDAINEPDRPIPSGRVPGRWGLALAIGWSLVSLAVALLLGPWVSVAATLGLILAWAYSAPPVRLKRNGWWGNLAVGISYEGLPWFAGAAVLQSAMPDPRIIATAVIYSIGAHGIMTLNDFKSIEGDRQMGIASLPAQLGAERACRLACAVMTLPQLVMVALLWHWNTPVYAAAVGALLLAQLVLMRRLLASPRERAPWYNATGTSLYVIGMLVTAFALRP